MELHEKTALVTGANRGIGRTIAHALEREGARVLAGVRALEPDHDVRATANLHAVAIDLTSRASIEASVLALEGMPVDILVNNAGGFAGGLLERQDVGRIYELLQSTLTGPIHLTRLILPGMLARGAGKIVNNDSSTPRAGTTSTPRTGPSRSSRRSARTQMSASRAEPSDWPSSSPRRCSISARAIPSIARAEDRRPVIIP